MSEIKYTPIESRILVILQDGMQHHPSEVLRALDDDQATVKNLSDHISRMRKKLERVGQSIICESHGRRVYYRQVRLLHSPYRD